MSVLAFILEPVNDYEKKFESLENISEREDFCSFVEALRHDLLNNRDQWENIALSDFLEAMQAWVEDMDGYYTSKGTEIPVQPSWRIFSEILMAARIYE